MSGPSQSYIITETSCQHVRACGVQNWIALFTGQHFTESPALLWGQATLKL